MTAETNASYRDAALAHWRAGRLAQAVDGLRHATRAGEPGAAPALLQAAADPEAPARARADAVEALDDAPDDPAVRRAQAYVAACGFAAAPDLERAIALRRRHAAEHDAQAALELGFLALQGGEPDTAESWFEQAALTGSGHAIGALLRLGSDAGSISQTAAERFQAFAASGHPLAGALGEAARGLPVRPPRRRAPEPPDAAAVARAAAGPEDPGAVLSDAPRVAVWAAAIAPALCDYLAAGAAGLLQPATIFDPSTGEARPDPYRQALSAALSDGEMDLALLVLKQRMAAMGGQPFDHAEPLAVLAYRPGDAYRAHCDYISDDGGAGSADLARSGQRAATCLVRLNAGYAGGETAFPRLDLSWSGAQGDALAFSNVGADGAPEPRSLHSGEPVVQGVKILASLWLRDRPQRPLPPA